MRVALFRLALPCFDDAGEGGGGGASAGQPGAAATGGTGAPASGAQGGNQPTGDPAAAAAGASSQPPPKKFQYDEDRSNWVPSHRVRQYSQEIERLRREYDVAQRRVAALSGVQPPAAQPSAEQNAIRTQLLAVMPELKDLLDARDDISGLKGLNLKETISALQQFAANRWQQQGTQTLSTLGAKIKAAYGGADIAPKQLARISRAFIGELEDNPELLARYEAGDPSVVDEFVTDYTQGVLDPYRRSTAAAAARQAAGADARRLPRGGGGSPTVGNRPPAIKPGDGDKFHKAAWDAMQHG